jgi:small-conductance mechanosensitive channel
MVRDFPKLLRRRLAGLLRIVLALVWVLVTLLVFDILAPALEWGRGVLGDRWSIGSLELSLGSIVSFVFTIWLSIQLSRFVRFVLEEDVFPRVSLARGLPGTISMLVRYAILAIGFLVAVAAAGIELSSFAIMAGALGVGIGFGLQSVVNNFVSGLILAFERPIQVGDTIEVGPLLGEVKSIGIRASTIRTYEGAEVIVPNGDLVSAQVTNWTLSDRRRRLLVPVGVAYGTDPGKVIDLLEQVASDHVDVIDHPPPTALFLGFGDSSLDFDLRFWTVKFERWREVKSEVTVAVNNALKQAGIEIPFPQRDLHVRSVDPGAARRLSGEPAEERAAGPTES